MGVSQNYGYLFGGPHNKDYSIFGSMLGFPYFGKVSCGSEHLSMDPAHRTVVLIKEGSCWSSVLI